jgi:F0F1-type ATP synthase membrane subunit c/vacuolar-type H+-ATPase subunit K
LQTIVLVLAVLGAIALGYRLLRALARFGAAFAEGTAASGIAEISARRGDLTTLAEQQATQRAARQRQRVDLLFITLWLAWLFLPPMTVWTGPLYAAAAPLWFLPYRPIRFTPPT